MKISSKFIFVVLFSFFLTSCYKKYRHTNTVCNGKLFIEQFNHKTIDVAYDYLTDSSNFRIYVGKFDNEHGYYRYNCQNDSIEISETYEGKVLNFRKYSLINLRNRNDFYFWNFKRFFRD